MSEPFSIRMPPDVRSIRLGAHQALLIDDFLEDPQALVAAACEAINDDQDIRCVILTGVGSTRV